MNKLSLLGGKDVLCVPGPALLALSQPHRGELRRQEVQLPAVHVPGQHHRQGRDDGQAVLLPRSQQQGSRGEY